MQRRRFAAPFLLSLALTALLASSASATTAYTYVASYGNDENACTLAAPCRTLTEALTQTSSGGEVLVLDSGDYDPVSITQSVSIIAAPGAHASIQVASGNGIAVNGSGIKVILRGLFVRGAGGDHAVYFQAGASLHISHSEFVGMSGRVLNMTASSGKLFVADSAFRNNAGGPTVDESASSAQATFVNVQSLDNTGRGINIEAGTATLRDVVVANNGGYGIAATAGASIDVERATVRSNYAGFAIYGSGTKATITNTTVTHNGDGVTVTDSATAVVSGTTITRNGGLGVYLAGGTMKSPGDNIVAENGTNVSGSISSISKQ